MPLGRQREAAVTLNSGGFPRVFLDAAVAAGPSKLGENFELRKMSNSVIRVHVRIIIARLAGAEC